jgi:hypothetical protein
MSGIVNSAKKLEPGVAIGLAAVAVAAATVMTGVGQLELAGHPNPNIWASPWIVGAIFIAGVGLLGAVIVFAAGLLSHHGDGIAQRVPVRAKEASVVEDTPITHSRQPQPEETMVVTRGQKWFKSIILLTVVIGVAVTDFVADAIPISALFPQQTLLFALVRLVAITFLTLVAAGTLGVALASRARDETKYASVGVAVTALAWLAPGMVMFLANLESNPPALETLPRAILLGAIYLASGLYIAFEARRLFYGGNLTAQIGWSPLLLRWVYLGSFALLIVIAAAINAMDLQAIFELLLPNYAEGLALFLAVGATFLALASVGRLGVSIARQYRKGIRYGSSDVMASAVVWLTFGLAIFLSQWLILMHHHYNAFLVNFGLSPSPGQQILGPLSFFAIYFVSGVCIIFYTGHFPAPADS